MTSEAWGNYWRGGALTTFGDKPTYQGELREFWQDFFSQLRDGAVILDMGAGNGALEEIAKDHCEKESRHLTIHAVDASQLVPRVQSREGDACRIEWHPNTRNEATGLEVGSVDAVVGNYAFEYGDSTATISEIRRVLKPGGKCQFLMHHADSVLITDTAGELAVLENALEKGGLFQRAEEFLREFGNINKPGQFEKARQSTEFAANLQRLDEAQRRAASVASTPNARALLTSLLNGMFSLISPPMLYEPKAVLLDRLAAACREYKANRARLRDMQRAAVDDARLREIIEQFKARALSAGAQPFKVCGFEEPVGWAVDVTDVAAF